MVAVARIAPLCGSSLNRIGRGESVECCSIRTEDEIVNARRKSEHTKDSSCLCMEDDHRFRAFLGVGKQFVVKRRLEFHAMGRGVARRQAKFVTNRCTAYIQD